MDKKIPLRRRDPMDRIEAIKCLVNPAMAFLLVLGWILFIGSGVDVPITYEGLTLGAAGTWVGKRAYKTYQEVKK